MKHEVNNKTFDEIFAQRGEQVQPENMVKSEVYLCTRAARHGYMLIEFFCLQPEQKQVEIVITGVLTDFGIHGFMQGDRQKGMLKSDASASYKATPDQVELLNSYRV